MLLLLAEDLQLQEELLLLEQPGVGRVHGRRPNIAGATFNQWGMGENGQHQPLFL